MLQLNLYFLASYLIHRLKEGKTCLVPTNSRKLSPGSSHHAKLSHLSPSPQVKHCKRYNADLLVRARHASANETRRVLARADLGFT